MRIAAAAPHVHHVQVANIYTMANANQHALQVRTKMGVAVLHAHQAVQHVVHPQHAHHVQVENIYTMASANHHVQMVHT